MPDDHIYQLVLRDSKEVSEELRGIQACRSQIFIGTLAAVGAVAMTTIAISAAKFPAEDDLSRLITATTSFFGLNDENAVSKFLFIWPWILTGAVVAEILLVIGILSTIEKARAINLRKGFLAALEPYLLRKATPRNYQGWALLKFAYSECGRRHKTDDCAYKKKCKNSQRCWTAGNYAAERLTEKKASFPGTFDSFMSLSSMVFACLFVAVVLSGTWAFLCLACYSIELNILWLVGIYAGSLFWGIVIAYLPERHKKRIRRERLRQGVARVKSELIVRLCSWAFIFIIILTGTSFLMSWIPYFVESPAFNITFKLIAIFGVGMSSGVLGFYLYAQMRRVRKGLYSVEALHHSWTYVLQHCCLMPEVAPRENVEWEMLHGDSLTSKFVYHLAVQYREINNTPHTLSTCEQLHLFLEELCEVGNEEKRKTVLQAIVAAYLPNDAPDEPGETSSPPDESGKASSPDVKEQKGNAPSCELKALKEELIRTICGYVIES